MKREGEIVRVSRWVAIVMLGIALSAPTTQAQGPIAEGNQWSKGDYNVLSAVSRQTFGICNSTTEKRKGKSVEVSVRCREADGVGSGKSITLRAHLQHWNGNNWKKVRKCKDTTRTTGNTSRVHELKCTLNLPRDAR